MKDMITNDTAFFQQNTGTEPFDPRSGRWVFSEHLQHIPKQQQQPRKDCSVSVKQSQQQQQQM